MKTNHQKNLFQAMAKPEFYPHPVSRVKQRETHISKVFLTGTYVYKIKKALNLEFLDYTSLPKRKYYCRQETVLNRRLSDNIYLGVVAITFKKDRYYLEGPGKPVEYAVKMRQLPEDRSMQQLLRRGKIDRAALETLARILAAFYNQAATGNVINPLGTSEAVRTKFEDNFTQTQRFVGELIDERIFQIIRAACRSFLQRRQALFQHRIETEKIRDCHGDLRCGHIYFVDGIQIVDCIEFNEHFRYSDITWDLAFLAMDLDFEGFAKIAWELLKAYVESANDPDVFVLIDFYKCHRALVRAKVNCLRLEHECLGKSGKTRLRSEITRYMDLAYQYAVQFTRPALWVVCGMPASGKSTIADELAGILGVNVLRSDRIRKDLFGLKSAGPVNLPFEEGIYSKGAGALTYGKLLLLAQEEIEKGASVILDATFSSEHHRREAVLLAANQDANIIFIECAAPENVMIARIIRRETEPCISDARLDHLEQFKKRFEPLNDLRDEIHIRVDTARPLAENMQKILSQDYILLSKLTPNFTRGVYPALPTGRT